MKFVYTLLKFVYQLCMTWDRPIMAGNQGDTHRVHFCLAHTEIVLCDTYLLCHTCRKSFAHIYFWYFIVVIRTGEAAYWHKVHVTPMKLMSRTSCACRHRCAQRDFSVLLDYPSTRTLVWIDFLRVAQHSTFAQNFRRWIFRVCTGISMPEKGGNLSERVATLFSDMHRTVQSVKWGILGLCRSAQVTHSCFS